MYYIQEIELATMHLADIFFEINEELLLKAKDSPMLVRFSKNSNDVAFDSAGSFCNEMPENMLSLSSITNKDFLNLIKIFSESPLYKIQLTFSLDKVLLGRRQSDEINKAVSKAFHPISLPEPFVEEVAAPYKFEGKLHHQFLDQLPIEELLQIYMNCLDADFMESQPDLHEALDLCHIISGNPRLFLYYYSGFIWGKYGCIALSKALPKARRLDYSPDVPLEIYTQKGAEIAKNMAFSEAESVIETWLHTDQYQAEYCKLLDAALLSFSKAGSFLWVKADIFKILEREAMKQVYASKLYEDFGRDLPVLKACKKLAAAIDHNAEYIVDDWVQKLLAQSLTGEMNYSGSAGEFVREAAQRIEEYTAYSGYGLKNT